MAALMVIIAATARSNPANAGRQGLARWVRSRSNAAITKGRASVSLRKLAPFLITRETDR
jgi:hypothetical protein